MQHIRVLSHFFQINLFRADSFELFFISFISYKVGQVPWLVGGVLSYALRFVYCYLSLFIHLQEGAFVPHSFFFALREAI